MGEAARLGVGDVLLGRAPFIGKRHRSGGLPLLWFTSLVNHSKVKGAQILRRALGKICGGGAQILRGGLDQVERVSVRCLPASADDSGVSLKQADPLQFGDVAFDGASRHLAEIRKPVDAREALARLAVVMVGDPVEDDLRCWLDAGLSHRECGHVMAHGRTLRGR